MVFLRDEGLHEDWKRLWWLTTGEQLHLRLLARDTGLFEPVVAWDDPRTPGLDHIRYIEPYDWGDASSYCVTSNGDFWACVARGSFLLRRSKDGNYSMAIAYNSVQYTGEPNDAKDADRRLSVSAVAAGPDDTLLLAGSTGLYRLKGNELVQELAFTVAPGSNWDPTHILALDDHSYIIGCGNQGGVYLLRKGPDAQWSCVSVDNSRDSIVW